MDINFGGVLPFSPLQPGTQMGAERMGIGIHPRPSCPWCPSALLDRGGCLTSKSLQEIAQASFWVTWNVPTCRTIHQIQRAGKG